MGLDITSAHPKKPKSNHLRRLGFSLLRANIKSFHGWALAIRNAFLFALNKLKLSFAPIKKLQNKFS
jgi:hypothetical protein